MAKYRGLDPNRLTREMKIEAAKAFRDLKLKGWMKDFKQAAYSTELLRTTRPRKK
tara:strand:- start:102 stop:266 length:165 start_codon:yes stop_codon:yes gene_type:complete